MRSLVRIIVTVCLVIGMAGCGFTAGGHSNLLPGTPSPAVAAAMQDLEQQARDGKVPHLTSILLASSGRQVYEAYFGEGSRNLLNDSRSVGKSFTALAAGCAMDQHKLGGIHTALLPLFADLQPIGHLDSVKAAMSLEDLLTMSSPLDAFDADPKSPGNEDRMHEQQAWTRWGIDLPVTQGLSRGSNGRYPFRYATINAVLLGQAIQRAVGEPVDDYIARCLFKPLGIRRYEFPHSPTGEAMTGGGVKLTSRDLLKLGQLVLDRGRAGDRQLVPALWVDACLTIHCPDTGAPGAGYGYYFWHVDVPWGGKTTDCWFMAGNGGNIVAVFPELKGVAVITRTDFNSPTTAKETLGFLAKAIVPALDAAR